MRPCRRPGDRRQHHAPLSQNSCSTNGVGVVGQTISTAWPAIFAGLFENGANAGTLTTQYANGSATGSTVIKRGSFCTLQ